MDTGCSFSVTGNRDFLLNYSRDWGKFKPPTIHSATGKVNAEAHGLVVLAVRGSEGQLIRVKFPVMYHPSFPSDFVLVSYSQLTFDHDGKRRTNIKLIDDTNGMKFVLNGNTVVMHHAMRNFHGRFSPEYFFPIWNSDGSNAKCIEAADENVSSYATMVKGTKPKPFMSFDRFETTPIERDVFNNQKIVEQDQFSLPTLTARRIHARLSHGNFGDLAEINQWAVGHGMSVEDMLSCRRSFVCTWCQLAKQTVSPMTPQQRGYIRTTIEKPMKYYDCPFGTVTYIDLETIKIPMKSPRNVMLSIVDMCREKTTMWLKTKADIPAALQYYWNHYAVMPGTPKYVYCDRAKELTSPVMEQLVGSFGAKLRTAQPHSQWQNGVAERSIRSKIEQGTANVLACDAPQSVIPLAINYSDSSSNRRPHSLLSKFYGRPMTPFEVHYKKMPDISIMRRFGCVAFRKLSDGERDKFGPKAVMGTFVGISHLNDAWLILQPNKMIVESRNVRFEERYNGFKPPPSIKSWFDNQTKIGTVEDFADGKAPLNEKRGVALDKPFPQSKNTGLGEVPPTLDSITDKEAIAKRDAKQARAARRKDAGRKQVVPKPKDKSKVTGAKPLPVFKPRFQPRFPKEPVEPVTTSVDDVFDEGRNDNDDDDDDDVEPPLPPQIQKPIQNPIEPVTEVENSTDENVSSNQPSPEVQPRRSGRARRPIERLITTKEAGYTVAQNNKIEVLFLQEAFAHAARVKEKAGIKIPSSVKEALSGPQAKLWQEAIVKELDNMKIHDVFERIEDESVIEDKSKVIPSHIVLDVKINSDGSFAKCKARLVAGGNMEKDVSPFENYSPTPSMNTFRLFMAIIVMFWNLLDPEVGIAQMDVNAAFLNGLMKKLLYMRLPYGTPINPKTKKAYIVKLKRCIYGLKVSGRTWFDVLSEFLMSIGFKKCESEPCLFKLLERDLPESKSE